MLSSISILAKILKLQIEFGKCSTDKLGPSYLDYLGIQFTPYSKQRDLTFLFLSTILFYC